MNTSHAKLYFAALIGNADGNWTQQEMLTAAALGLKSAFLEAPDFIDKVESGELNNVSAFYILNNLDKDEQMDCLVGCLATAISDGHLDDSEMKILYYILENLNSGITAQELLDEFNRRIPQ